MKRNKLSQSVVLEDGNISENGRVSCSDHDRIDLTCFIESVEKELHSMSVASLFKYIKSLVDKEVKNLFNDPEEDTLNKVTLVEVLILCFLFKL